VGDRLKPVPLNREENPGEDRLGDMRPRLLFSFLFFALLVLAAAGWLVRGPRTI
jgi:hypothetical protein